MEYNPAVDEDRQTEALLDLVRPYLAALFANPVVAAASVAGADILSDIWNAVSSLLAFPSGFFNWMVANVGGALNWITSTAGNVKDFIAARVEWVANNIVLPAVNAVAGVVGSLPGAITAAASWVWDRVSPALNAGWDFVSNLITWLLAQVRTAIDAVAGFVESSFTWLWGVIQPAFNTVMGHVVSVAEWVLGNVRTAINAVTNTVLDLGTWLFNRIVEARDFTTAQVGQAATWVAGQTFNYVIQGAAALGDGFQSALEWLISSAFGDFAGAFQDVLFVPWKMLRGEYSNLEGIITDLHFDMPGGSLTKLLYSLCAFIPTLASLTVGLGPIYASDALQNANKIVGPQLLSMTDARDAWLRNLISDAALDDELSRLGFDTSKRAILRDLFFEPAPPSDLTRFLVRGVFDPAERAQFSLDADFPEAAIAEARKVGLSAETMRNYWAAHWQLPSPTQLYEMKHRGLINSEQLDAALKAADYAPIWRPRLAAISDIVPGRIDLRRMFAAGVIDEARLLRGYKELGYSDADAAIMADFAKKSAAGVPKELPRGVILEGYRNGELERPEAVFNLEELGFETVHANLMLDLEDLQNARELQDLNEDAIEADFKAGIVNEAQALTSLAGIGVPARRAQLLVNKWRSRHSAKTYSLSVAQIQQAVREQLLPDAVALQRFAALGVNPGDAQLLLALARPQAPADEPPTLSLAQLFRALREGLLNQAQLAYRLQRRGFSGQDVAILVELATPDLAPDEPAQLTKAELIAAAKKDILPIDAVQRRLAARGFSAQDVDTLLELQGFKFAPTGQVVEYPRRDLTVAQLSKSYRTGLIEEKELRFRLAELGYSEEDIELLVELATPEPANG